MTDEQKTAYWAQYQQWQAYYAAQQAGGQPASPAPSSAPAASAAAQVPTVSPRSARCPPWAPSLRLSPPSWQRQDTSLVEVPVATSTCRGSCATCSADVSPQEVFSCGLEMSKRCPKHPSLSTDAGRLHR